MNSILKKIGIVITVFFCYFSCETNEKKVSKFDNNSLVISFRFTANKDFKFRLQLNEPKDQKTKQLSQEEFFVKGDNREHVIDVSIDKSLVSKKMKLIFFSEDDENKVVIGKTTITKGAKQFEIKPIGFWYNFNPSKAINLKESEVEFVLSKDSGKNYFVTRNQFDKRIASLFTKETPKELLKDSTFRVFIDGFVEKDLKANLLYKNASGTYDTLTKQVPKRTQEQRITFELPKHLVPQQFKIVFNDNSHISPETVELKRIVLNKNVDRIVIEDTALAVYFNGGKDFKFDPDNRYLSGAQKAKQLQIETKENLENRIINRYLRTSY
jgi:hypothetical protein